LSFEILKGPESVPPNFSGNQNKSRGRSWAVYLILWESKKEEEKVKVIEWEKALSDIREILGWRDHSHFN